MILFGENAELKDAEKIDIDDLDFLTRQLDAFITIYSTRIKVHETRHREVLLALDKICDKLKNRRYHELINDPNVISYTPIDHSEIDFMYTLNDSDLPF